MIKNNYDVLKLRIKINNRLKLFTFYFDFKFYKVYIDGANRIKYTIFETNKERWIGAIRAIGANCQAIVS